MVYTLQTTLEHNAYSWLHKQSFVFTFFFPRVLPVAQSRPRFLSCSFRQLLQRLWAVTPVDPSCSLFCYGALQQRFHHFLPYSILYCHPGPESPWAKLTFFRPCWCHQSGFCQPPRSLSCKVVHRIQWLCVRSAPWIHQKWLTVAGTKELKSGIRT